MVEVVEVVELPVASAVFAPVDVDETLRRPHSCKLPVGKAAMLLVMICNCGGFTLSSLLLSNLICLDVTSASSTHNVTTCNV